MYFSTISANMPKRMRWETGSATKNAAEYSLNVTIYDWDDTLCPSTWLLMQELLMKATGYNEMNDEYTTSLFTTMQSCIVQNIIAAKEQGPVAIITNGYKEWVRQAASRLMPGLLQHLEAIEIISAQELYSGVSDDPFVWKQLAFLEYAASQFAGHEGRLRTLISVGDSCAERRALVDVAARLPGTPIAIKSVKMAERPTLEDLALQLGQLAGGGLGALYAAETNQDLAFEKGELVPYSPPAAIEGRSRGKRRRLKGQDKTQDAQRSVAQGDQRVGVDSTL